jgi:site-specific recombinase XerD
LPEALSDDQVRRLLGGITNPIHKGCFSLMYACGLRITEAVSLEVTAIDRARMVLRIIGKGNKERLVPLPQPVYQDLRALWCTHRSSVASSSSARLRARSSASAGLRQTTRRSLG